jgi:hypothetical protein
MSENGKRVTDTAVVLVGCAAAPSRRLQSGVLLFAPFDVLPLARAPG